MFKYERRAYYHETDQMGIIHHSNYLKWMEEARIALMDKLGFSYKKMEELLKEMSVNTNNICIKLEEIANVLSQTDWLGIIGPWILSN